jgi:hypothetical protein
MEERTKKLHADKTLYMWRLVFKNTPYGASAERKYDLQTGRTYADISLQGYHDFVGTHKSSSEEWDKWREAGYGIQDCFNLGKYEND